MKKFNLADFTKGWFMGDFEPTLFKTRDFEICIKEYNKGDKEDSHVHKIAKEYTIAVCGKYKMNGEKINKGDIILIEAGEYADFECIEAGYNVVVKIPSVKNDKYLADN